jgi:hypothetical protein
MKKRGVLRGDCTVGHIRSERPSSVNETSTLNLLSHLSMSSHSASVRLDRRYLLNSDVSERFVYRRGGGTSFTSIRKDPFIPSQQLITIIKDEYIRSGKL